MASCALEELWMRRRAQAFKLAEVADLTRQIAAAAEHRDGVSVQMLLDEREGPVRGAWDLEEEIRALVLDCPEEEAIRLNELLHGAPPETEAERPLAEQTAQYRRRLDEVRELDERLSVRLGEKRSYYKKFR